jgi:alanyl-tRNA synthetase
VRIVQVPDWDSCACCGIHVATTGQVGLVKIFSAMGFRGGTRMEMACGKRALEILNQIFDQNRQVSQAFSAQMLDTGAAARNMNEVLENQKHAYAQLQRKLFTKIAKDYVNQGDVLHFEEGLEPVMVRELTDAIAENCGGTAAVFSGTDESGYNFCMVTRNGDLRNLGKALTQQFNGRGGGKPICQQGRIGGTKSEICAFFETN